jgi:hypothetical protein
MTFESNSQKKEEAFPSFFFFFLPFPWFKKKIISLAVLMSPEHG